MQPVTVSSRLSQSGKELLELLASMRFAISLLALISIASVIGTVVQQRQPANNYVNQFGPFWADLFGRLDLFTVYSAPWFLLALAFLVVSTSLCVARNTPKILRDLRDAKLHLRPASLRAYPHKTDSAWTLAPADTQATVLARLGALGWTPKLDARADGTLIAARKGGAHKLGYIAAHSAIVLICLGGLLDGDLVVRTLAKIQGKTLYTGTGNTVPTLEPHSLDVRNPSYRANLFVPEGDSARMALLHLPGGLLVQPLPFELELKRFVVEYYDTGMPKLFASDVVLRDENGEHPARIEVNKPLIHRGIAIYQSSFEDGGSALRLKLEPWRGNEGRALEALVGKPQPLPGTRYTLEPSDLRVINVENLAPPASAEAASNPPQPPALAMSGLGKHLGSGAKDPNDKRLRNIGPSLTYRLRDPAGQALEFQSYMVPVELDGTRVFLMGVRDSVQEEFRYLRLPADENDSLAGWLRLRRALNDPALRAQAARAVAEQAAPRADLQPQLQATAEQVLALFSGEQPVGEARGGLAALGAHVEQRVPAGEREGMANVLMRLLNSGLLELDRAARARDGVAWPEADDARQRFMAQAVLALSDSAFYPVPYLVTLDGFDKRHASVFQVARAPGQTLVYLGAVLLTIGVFAMLYIRERRLWLWLAPHGSGTSLTMALSSSRPGSELDAEFAQLQAALQPPVPSP
ncbi:MAG: cytochrome c biogenesis protein ResB [Inhella sp.]|uniref:cytochrome c biogenesis protein ResB n=1 Tax=Inhella sp. TaxID=1921806 RepID=UPI00391FB0F5